MRTSPDSPGHEDPDEELSPTVVQLFRSTLAMGLLLGGMALIGTLYNTGHLLIQLLAAVLMLPFCWAYFLVGANALAARRWTTGVHGILALAAPSAAIGIHGWWLLWITDPIPCRITGLAEYEDSRGLRYEHQLSCADAAVGVDYTSRGDPVGTFGQTIDVFLDPTGVMGPLPTSAVPGVFGWISMTTVVLAALVYVYDSVTSRGKQP